MLQRRWSVNELRGMPSQVQYPRNSIPCICCQSACPYWIHLVLLGAYPSMQVSLEDKPSLGIAPW